MKKRSKISVCLLIAAVLGFVYSFYIMWYVVADNATAVQTGGEAYALGVALATTLILPHMLCAVLAAMFNIVGFAACSRWASLTGAILYAVAGLLFFPYLPFVLVQMILSFVGFARLKEIRAYNSALLEAENEE